MLNESPTFPGVTPFTNPDDKVVKRTVSILKLKKEVMR